MADIITQSKTVLVRLTSPANDDRSIVLDNPRQSITLAQIKQGFEPILAMKILVGNKGDTLTAVEYATITNTEKIKLGDSDIVVTVSPNVFEIPPSATTPSRTFTVTGSTVKAAYFSNIVANAEVTGTNYEINGQDIEVSIKFTEGVTQISGNLNIVTQATTITLPVTIQT